MSKKRKIEFVANCTEREHEKAWRIVQFRCGLLQFWWIILLVSLLLFLMAVNMLCATTKTAPEGLIYIFFAVAIILPIVYSFFCVQYVNKRKRYYLEKYMAIGARELTVFSHSISVSSVLVSTDIPFSDCRFLINRKDFFLLIKDRRGYLIIPKRDVPNEELKELKKRLKRASVFYRLWHRG